jgi:hypothetical protein
LSIHSYRYAKFVFDLFWYELRVEEFCFCKELGLGVVFEFGNSLEVASMICFVVATGVKLLENRRIKIVVLMCLLKFYCNMGEIILISNKKRVAFTFPGRCLFIYLYIMVMPK